VAFAFFPWDVFSNKPTPAGRDLALAGLRKVHVLTPDSVTRAPRATLEAAVSPAGGSVELRIDALRAGAQVFQRHRALPEALRGSLAGARRSLTVLTQLDTAGAHRMLLFAGGHAVVPVDAGVRRVALRLGYGHPKLLPARRVRRVLGSLLSGDLDACRRAFIYLSHHAALTCTEREPHCRICPLAPECPWSLESAQRSRQSQ
jgi:endonuclease III